MKNFIFLTMLFLSFGSCEDNTIKDEVSKNSSIDYFATEIGKTIQGNLILTFNRNKLKTTWAKFISKNSTLSIIFTTITIEEDQYGTYLLGRDEVNGHKARVDLVKVNNSFYEKITKNSDNSYRGGCTTTCSGCTAIGPNSHYDCVPKNNFCTACPSGNGTCIKTVTCGGEQRSVLTGDTPPHQKQKLGEDS